jgi:hypothetical protein
MTAKHSAPSLSAPAIPEELSSLFGKPPLLSGEDRTAYEGLLTRVSAAIRPEDGIVWLLMKELVDLSWDIHRWRSIRANVINMTQKDALVNILESLLGKEDIPEGSDRVSAAEALAEKWFANPDSRITVKKILYRLDLNSSAINAQAVVLRLGDLDAIEDLIESAERRRNQILSVIEFYRDGLASQLSKATKIIENEAQEVPLLPLGGGK